MSTYSISTAYPEDLEHPGVGRLDAADEEVLPVLFLQRVRQLGVRPNVKVGRRHGGNGRALLQTLRHRRVVDGLGELGRIVVDVVDDDRYIRTRCKQKQNNLCQFGTKIWQTKQFGKRNT